MRRPSRPMHDRRVDGVRSHPDVERELLGVLTEESSSLTFPILSSRALLSQFVRRATTPFD
jgi:hypothetical protein